MSDIVIKLKKGKCRNIGIKKIPLLYNIKQCGIYCIRNTVNGKIYIGSSKNAYHRVKSQHFDRLQSNRHTNPHLQSAWNQHGKKSFEYFLIEECRSDILIVREQWYLDNTLCLDNQYGYNINVLAERTVLTPEQCKKISKNKMGHSVSQACREKLRKYMLGRRTGTNHATYGKYPIYQYTKDGRHVGTFNSLKEASDSTNIGIYAIKQCYLGRLKTGGKFIWKRPNSKQNLPQSECRVANQML